MTFEDYIKSDSERSKYKVYCRHCGHSIIFTPTVKTNKTICDHCGNYIYKNKKEEFKELVIKRIVM